MTSIATENGWIGSPERTARNKKLLLAFKPGIHAVLFASKTAITRLEPGTPAITYEERSLIPGQVYTIPKVGDRGPAGSRDESKRYSELLSVLMLDELAQLNEVLAGNASLFGPRGTTPEHRVRLFEALEPEKAEYWEHILSSQQHGLIGTYANRIHAKVGSPISYDDEVGLTDHEVYREANTRFNDDKLDYENASKEYDNKLAKAFGKMILSRLTRGKIGA